MKGLLSKLIRESVEPASKYLLKNYKSFKDYGKSLVPGITDAIGKVTQNPLTQRRGINQMLKDKTSEEGFQRFITGERARINIRLNEIDDVFQDYKKKGFTGYNASAIDNLKIEQNDLFNQIAKVDESLPLNSQFRQQFDEHAKKTVKSIDYTHGYIDNAMGKSSPSPEQLLKLKGIGMPSPTSRGLLGKVSDTSKGAVKIDPIKSTFIRGNYGGMRNTIAHEYSHGLQYSMKGHIAPVMDIIPQYNLGKKTASQFFDEIDFYGVNRKWKYGQSKDGIEIYKKWSHQVSKRVHEMGESIKKQNKIIQESEIKLQQQLDAGLNTQLVKGELKVQKSILETKMKQLNHQLYLENPGEISARLSEIRPRGIKTVEQLKRKNKSTYWELLQAVGGDEKDFRKTNKKLHAIMQKLMDNVWGVAAVPTAGLLGKTELVGE